MSNVEVAYVESWAEYTRDDEALIRIDPITGTIITPGEPMPSLQQCDHFMAGLEGAAALAGANTRISMIYSLQQMRFMNLDAQSKYLAELYSTGGRPYDIHAISIAAGDATESKSQGVFVDPVYQRFMESTVGGLTVPGFVNISPVWRPDGGTSSNPGGDIVKAMQRELNGHYRSVASYSNPTNKELTSVEVGKLMVVEASSWVALSNLGHFVVSQGWQGMDIAISAHARNNDMSVKLDAGGVATGITYVGDVDTSYRNFELAKAMEVQVYRRGQHPSLRF